VSAIVVFVVLAVAGWAVTELHRDALRDNLEETLEQAAEGIAGAVADGRDPAPSAIDDDAGYQVVGPSGEVALASGVLAGLAPLADPPDDDATHVRRDLPGDDGEAFLVLSERLDDGSVVHVTAPTDDVEESAAALRRAFVVAVPVTTAVLAVALWFLVGGLLRRAELASLRQQRFVADAAHELRSPLTRMRTELEVDLAHPGRAEPLATHRIVLEEAVGLQHLVDDLLELARLDAPNGPQGDLAAVDLDVVVERVAADLRARGDVAVDTSGIGPAQVSGQAEQLRRAIANLADNAARHATGTVSFEVAEEAGQAIVAVVDDGPGIPAADRTRVFERFSRVDEARSAATGGTGLGLAIAREIVERHGGTIAVDADHAPGARVVIRLPSI
jgi:signal transduction histidine kinase